MTVIAHNVLNRKIEETKTEIKHIEATDFSVYGLKNGLLKELNQRLDELCSEREQLLESAYKEKISLCIHGENVEKGKISNRVLIDVLSSFQAMADSAADIVMNNTPSKRGRYKKTVLNTTDFKVLVFSEGSFCVHLEKENPHEILDSVTSNAMIDINERRRDSHA